MKKHAQLLNEYMNEINNNDIDETEAEELEDDPLSNFEIEKYNIPSSKVVLYKQLENFNNIEDLFGTCHFVFLLYQPIHGSMGHWILLSKFGNKLEYFCSYGLPIDSPITKWYKDGQRKYLGELLSNRKDLHITYNAYPFQKKSADVSTCGRWCILRAKTIVENNLSLAQFIDLMISLKKDTNRPFDNIVSDVINI